MGASKRLFEELRESEVEQTQATDLTEFVKPLHLTKAASEGNAEAIADLVREGNANPLDVATKIKWMIATLEQSLKLIQGDCVAEIEKHHGKATVNGAEIIKKEVGTKYDYSSCNDSAWNAMTHIEAEAKEKRAEREKFLKNLPGPMTIADDETGEMITINPPLKSSSTSIAVTFK